MEKDFMMKNAVPGGRVYPIDYPAQAPQRFGRFSPVIKVQRIALDDARDDVRIQIGGSMFWAQNASSLTASMDVRFNTEQSDKVKVTWGFSIGGLKFSEIYVTNSAQAGEYIDILVVVEDVNLRTLNPNNVNNAVTILGTVTVDQAKNSVFETAADVTVTAAAAAAEILAANTDRVSAIITSVSTNTQEVRIGDGDTGAARGVQLNPGESLEIETTAAIYAYTPAGSDVVLSIAYTED